MNCDAGAPGNDPNRQALLHGACREPSRQAFHLPAQAISRQALDATFVDTENSVRATLPSEVGLKVIPEA
ncbi:protein of unknown function [Aminobacter niigataensis]|nr:protein of unknown function [Aminobacter niigataensis]